MNYKPKRSFLGFLGDVKDIEAKGGYINLLDSSGENHPYPIKKFIGIASQYLKKLLRPDYTMSQETKAIDAVLSLKDYNKKRLGFGCD
jgi:hypothetical protein